MMKAPDTGQFASCGSLQVMVDVAILAQVVMYRGIATRTYNKAGKNDLD